MKDLVIMPVLDEAKIPFNLLLIADPSRKNIDAYISESFIYAAYIRSELIGCYVLRPVDHETIEIMNIVVSQNLQNQGIGTSLLSDAFEKSRAKGFKKIKVGTGNSSLGQLHLYKKAGFKITQVLPDYFRENYDEPIFENGIECRDMIVLMRML